MDSFEAVKIVHGRILKFEPEIVARKIIGYIFLQEVPIQEIIRFALGPDTLIQTLIQIAKPALFSPPTAYRYLDPSLQVKSRPFPNDCYCTEAAEFNSLGQSSIHNHRNNYPPHMFGGANNSHDEDQVISPGSLQKLESEITELLRSGGGIPVSIASLPCIYLEKYGRKLQISVGCQRHGKAGSSLTELLARMNNSICLIDIPHGQHAVILVEDAPKYAMDVQGERDDPGPIVTGSRQIYLTFPAESDFTEEDFSNYFSTFGYVQDVSVIPWQQKQMFGFVTFLSSETVKLILSKGNPHYICGARVLVKPYREKLHNFLI